ncbi:MAG TPA: GNAT family protein [Candidatus Dormibacteraeota bacterium]|nr:GNAT family protein [Candidatus Dormibacteraeota bacterium]
MLAGELVTLRPIEPDDYPALAVFANDVELELLGGGDPPTPTPQASVAAAYEQLRENPDSINFAITANEAAGKLIGQCGLWRHDQLGRTVELGITIGVREYWGRGYGREAVALLVDYAFRLRNVRKVHLSVHANNTRAIRSYTAAGFIEEGRLREHVWSDGAYVDLVLMGRLRRPDDDPPLLSRKDTRPHAPDSDTSATQLRSFADRGSHAAAPPSRESVEPSSLQAVDSQHQLHPDGSAIDQVVPKHAHCPEGESFTSSRPGSSAA